MEMWSKSAQGIISHLRPKRGFSAVLNWFWSIFRGLRSTSLLLLLEQWDNVRVVLTLERRPLFDLFGCAVAYSDWGQHDWKDRRKNQIFRERIVLINKVEFRFQNFIAKLLRDSEQKNLCSYNAYLLSFSYLFESYYICRKCLTRFK